jgi:hypothetical protein
VDRALILALERTYGPPIDSYLNGWQVWLEPYEELLDVDGAPVELEHRLHPPAGFTQPTGLSHHDIWEAVATQLEDGADRLRLGDEQRPLDALWVLLEVYPAFGEPVAPDELGRAVGSRLGRPALAAGRVDHQRLGARWRATKGDFDLPTALLDELGVVEDA